MEITTTDVRDRISEIVNEIAFAKKQFILCRRGKKLAALVPMEDFERIETLKNMSQNPKVEKEV